MNLSEYHSKVRTFSIESDRACAENEIALAAFNASLRGKVFNFFRLVGRRLFPEHDYHWRRVKVYGTEARTWGFALSLLNGVDDAVE